MNTMDDLIERYMQGLTSEEEELELRRRMAQESPADPRYADMRALLGYHAVRRARVQKALRSVVLHRLAVAAALCLVAGCGLYVARTLAPQPAEDCFAHINGTYITAPDVVQQEMEKDMKMIFAE